MQSHYLVVDSSRALTGSSPRGARVGLVVAALIAVGLLAAWLLGLLG